jgi:phenylacetate-CoA ligase
MIEVARQQSLRRGLSNVSFEVMNSEAVSLAPESYDAIVCSSVLEYVEDDERLIRDLVAALRPGGALLISVPHTASLVGKIEDAVKRLSYFGRRLSRADLEYSRRRYHVNDLSVCLRQSSLETVEVTFFELPLLGQWGIWLSRWRGLSAMLLVAAVKQEGRARPREPYGITRRTWGRIVRACLVRKVLWERLPSAFRAPAGRILGILPARLTLGGKFVRNARFLRTAQDWPAERAYSYQMAQLRSICTVAYQRTEYYRRLFDEAGIHPARLLSADDFHKVPTLDRDIVAEHAQQMLSVPPGHPLADPGSTGGTSGKPFHFYMNANRSPTEYSYLVVSWERAGYRFGMPMAVLRGRTVPMDRNGLRHEYDPILRHHYYSSFHMSDGNMVRYLEHIATIGSCFLHVYPSSVAALARFCHRTGVRPPSNIRGIIAESEIIYPEQRKMVEEVFGCPYFSCYGHSEKIVLAAECEHSTDYHVWPTYGYFELLDESGRPVTAPGRRGEIVGTGFINTVMPFIRYRTGDWATYVGNCCEACGREHVIIRDIRGHRTQEVLIAADGSEIPWAALNMHDNTFIRVRQFQFMQEMLGKAVLRIVPAEGFCSRDGERIHRNLRRKLEDRLAVTIELVDAISLTARGKAIYVDQRIPQEQGGLVRLTDTA